MMAFPLFLIILFYSILLAGGSFAICFILHLVDLVVTWFQARKQPSNPFKDNG